MCVAPNPCHIECLNYLVMENGYWIQWKLGAGVENGTGIGSLFVFAKPSCSFIKAITVVVSIDMNLYLYISI